MRVILVDDEKKFINMLARRLGFRGIAADAVYSGEEAIKNVEKKHYDVAVLDIKMPGISGHELKAELNKIDPGLAVIFVSGHGGATGSGPDAGGETDVYLSKPLDLDLLIETIGKLAGR